MNTLFDSGWRTVCVALCLVVAPVLAEEAAPPAVQKSASAPQEVVAQTGSSTADHAKFEELQREFASGPEVTTACLECHTEAAKQISLATQQQRTGTEQVVQSMSEIAKIAKSNVAGAGQTTSSTVELASLADELRQAVSRFQLGSDDS